MPNPLFSQVYSGKQGVTDRYKAADILRCTLSTWQILNSKLQILNNDENADPKPQTLNFKQYRISKYHTQ